jgi:hypothetical protein
VIGTVCFTLIDLLFLPLGPLSAADVTTLIETPTAQPLEPPAAAAGGLQKQPHPPRSFAGYGPLPEEDRHGVI